MREEGGGHGSGRGGYGVVWPETWWLPGGVAGDVAGDMPELGDRQWWAWCENFVDICDLFKTEEGRDDVIRLRVFSLTLTGEAKAWLRSLEPSSITTWEGLRSKFLSRFFPPSKIDKLRAENPFDKMTGRRYPNRGSDSNTF
ncbi:hypothetical protein OSB04_017132 [Centaurea solstitialis]|uniref:Retrotransposon gag domain-containing protein n=1 Tax=Centaurea solstitialis TaxID=347529 RepID=A0AA38W968_9ASTR|nr:hypothetical protein OSB04_017132 [Centaurea solstitialis]